MPPADHAVDLRDASRGERLQKVLAEAGVGSRRACEALIARGAVEVNGEPVIALPAWVDPAQDDIRVNGKRVGAHREGRRGHVYVMLYKPRRTMCTMDDPGGRRTVAELVEHHSGERLFPVGRLDYDSMGLLLMTNDGDLTQHLTHPRYGVEKTYRVIVRGRLDEESVRKLGRGVYLSDRREGRTLGGSRTAGVHIEIVRREPERMHLDITLHEGRNRQVRRMLADVGCAVKKLTRIRLGPLELRELRLGEWRDLTPHERRLLWNSVRRARRTDEAPGTRPPRRAKRPNAAR
ncbi:MAG: pseudouridine synthase [Planctomycetota bacterium]